MTASLGPVTRLAAELVCSIFDPLSLNDLLTTSWVCREWRSIARGHPTFWKDIALRSCARADVEFFLARLVASDPTAPISVSTFTGQLSALEPKLAREVLDCLFANLHRLESFALDPWLFDRALIPAIYDALRRPAPLLQIFHFAATGGPCTVPLPSDLFAGQAPRLRQLVLHGVILAEPAPAVFSLVERVYYNARNRSCVSALPSTRSHLVMTQFPAAHVLQCDVLTMDTSLLPSTPAFDMNKVTVFAFMIKDVVSLGEFLRWPPAVAARTLDLRMLCPDAEVNTRLIEHLLPGELSLTGKWKGGRKDDLTLDFTPVGALRQRVVVQALAAVLPLLPITSREVAMSLVLLNVPVDALTLFGLWFRGSFPALTHLVLWISRDAMRLPLPLDITVHTPVLETVMLIGGGASNSSPGVVHSEAIRDLITVLVISRPTVGLHFRDIRVVGELAPMGEQGAGTIHIGRRRGYDGV
ncbi:hypothetical protein EXIGLDRAFT_432441 [Exidia glandulosa HHB12029]|uniref:F-box domain-containing protein n=1 Tax=Exidia glandulosa HHB12029 TaxID=1314781 RepID=A0A165KHW4_EXIGL|nr:hypothetical protein EXIGLDRAFT_432441 [Exidia glandulosa HHB12029]